MDYREEQFLRMQQSDTPKVPFYMSYPMQNLYLTEMEYEKDMDRMKELYPRDVSRIMDVIEDECDKMEYEGSLMFDEYPDRLMLEQVTERIYQTVKNGTDTVMAEEFWGGNNPPPSPPGRPGSMAQSDRCHVKQRDVPQKMPPPPLQKMVVIFVILHHQFS